MKGRHPGRCKKYQETLSYTSSKVDYSVGENLFMLLSNMELRIRSGTVRYNNKILISDEKFIPGKNDEVNSLETPAIKTNSLETPAIESHANTAQGLTHAPAISHEDEKTAFYPVYCWWLYCLVSFSMKVPRLTSSFVIWNTFR